jgi:hypothetical protein
MFNLFQSLFFGSRHVDSNGDYVKESQSRFLLFFHDFGCFYLTFCAGFIFVAQLMAVILIFNQARDNVVTSCDESDLDCEVTFHCEVTSSNSNSDPQYAIILCIMYASAAAVEDLFVCCLPFEIVGVSKEEYCFIVNQRIKACLKPPRILWFKAFSKLFSRSDNKVEDIAEFYDFVSAIGPTMILVFNNFYLTTTIGFIMAVSPDLLDLVQNFIAVEILVKVHEIIPRIMRIRDR